MALVTCSECAREISDKAGSCPGCGAPVRTTLSAMPPDSAAIPNHILESLKTFEKHTTLTCLECGYEGMMGIKADIVPWYVSWWTIGAVVVVFVIFGGTGHFFGIALGVLRLVLVKQLVICPSCNSELTTKAILNL